jgi:hypothetical protein
MIDSAYCDLQPLNTFYNNKPLFQCEYCGLTVGLESPDTKILCFKKMEDLSSKIHQIHTGDTTIASPIHAGSSKAAMSDALLDQLAQDAKDKQHKETKYNHEDNLCSKEQIEERLSICNTCEYFQNSSCLLCGCTVIREANHKNKLAHKDQSCPANKWGPISN